MPTTNLKAKLHLTKWGWALFLNELGITLPNLHNEAFHTLGSINKEFHAGMEIAVNLHFEILYKEKKEGSGEAGTKWAIFKTKTYEEALNHKEYLRYKLNPNSIVPYFTQAL